MIKLCKKPHGKKKGAHALAHCQVIDNDPLRFFVTREGDIYINPIIKKHTKVTVDSLEGCMFYPDNNDIIVQRYHKCDVIYYDKDWNEINYTISGRLSKIFQHELNHFEGKTIYDKEN